MCFYSVVVAIDGPNIDICHAKQWNAPCERRLAQFLPSNDPRGVSEKSNGREISQHNKSSSERGNEVRFFYAKDFHMEPSRTVSRMHLAMPCTQVHSTAMEIYIRSRNKGQKAKAHI